MDERTEEPGAGQGSVAPPGGGDDQPGGGGPRGPRYDRRRFLVILGGLIAGLVGVVELLRHLGGGASSGSAGPGTRDLLSSFPVLNVEDPPHVAPDQWVIEVDGLVETPLKIDHGAWSALPRLEETVDFHCVEGWSVAGVRWAGVAPRTLLDRARLKPEGTFIVFHTYAGKYSDGLPLDQALQAQTVLADTLDGKPLPDGHGGPVRLVVPAQLGYKSVKWVTRLEVVDKPVEGYWEQRGYPIDAPI